MIIIICKRWVILHHRGDLGQTPPHSKKLCLCHPIALLRSIGSKVQTGSCQGRTPISKVPIAVVGKAVALCQSEIDNNLLPIPYYPFVLLFFGSCLNLTCYLLSSVYCFFSFLIAWGSHLWHNNTVINDKLTVVICRSIAIWPTFDDILKDYTRPLSFLGF